MSRMYRYTYNLGGGGGFANYWVHVFSWPSFKVWTRIRNDLKSSIWIRPKSFRIHNTKDTSIGYRYLLIYILLMFCCCVCKIAH
jgi:hypothetical protein